MNHIHPTALVDPAARLGDGVRIGAYAVVGPEVSLGARVQVESHAVLAGDTELGEGCHVFPFASIGMPPQDKKYKGERSRLVIGANTIIREHVTINPGTEGGGLVTRVGSDCLLMVGSHVAHDCQVGDRVILVNNATLAGHVTVGDAAIVGGLSAVHQFVRIGSHAMIGGMSGVEHDVIPYGMAMGNRARLVGLNLVGLKRAEVAREAIRELMLAYDLIFADDTTLAERLDSVAEKMRDNALVMDMVGFIRAGSQRALCQPKADDAN